MKSNLFNFFLFIPFHVSFSSYTDFHIMFLLDLLCPFFLLLGFAHFGSLLFFHLGSLLHGYFSFFLRLCFRSLFFLHFWGFLHGCFGCLLRFHLRSLLRFHLGLGNSSRFGSFYLLYFFHLRGSRFLFFYLGSLDLLGG